MNDIKHLRDAMIPYDKMMNAPHMGKQSSKLARGVLYRDDGVDAYGRPIFTKVAENTVVLGGAIAALERLSNVESSFRPNTLNKILGVNDGHPYVLGSTPIALFGCGNGGAGMNFGDVYDPSIKQNNITGLIPMMVSEGELTGDSAEKYKMRTTVQTPDGTKLNCWYLKEFDMQPKIVSLWKDAPAEDEDGTEITTDISDSESTNGVESFVQFKLVIDDDDLRSYYIAMGMAPQARYNSVGLYLGQKITVTSETLGSYEDYVNVSLFSVVNLNNEALAERKVITYYYRVYALI